MRTSRITILLAAVAAALLLGTASAAPSAALASTRLGTDGAVDQYYWPSSSGYYGPRGYEGYYDAYPYGGSGTAAWYGWGAYPGSYWGSGYYPSSHWNGGYYPGSYWGSGYYPGGYGYWNWFDSSPYEGSPGYPYYDYGSHYGYGGPADVNPDYGSWVPRY